MGHPELSFPWGKNPLSLWFSMKKIYKAGLGQPAGKDSHNQKKPPLLLWDAKVWRGPWLLNKKKGHQT